MSPTKHASGDKRPIAIIVRTKEGELIFDADGRQIDGFELWELTNDQEE